MPFLHAVTCTTARIRARLWLVPLVSLLMTPGATAEDFDLNLVKNSLVAVRYDSLSGEGVTTGCFVQMYGRLYIVAPQFPFVAARKITVQTLAGRKLAFTDIEPARNCDLVRLTFRNDASKPVKPFVLKPHPKPEAELEATGFSVNNEGNNSYTKAGGTTRVYAETIETDVNIRDLKPGSPLVDIDGQVFGVVTHTRTGVLNWDSRKRDYRDEPKRLTVRLPGKIDWAAGGDEFLTQGALISDASRFGGELQEFLRTDGYINLEALRTYASAKEKSGAYLDPAFSKSLQSFCMGYERALLSPEKASKSKTRIYQEELHRRLTAFAALLDQPLGKFSRTMWYTTLLAAEAEGLKPFFKRLKDEFAAKVARHDAELAKFK